MAAKNLLDNALAKRNSGSTASRVYADQARCRVRPKLVAPTDIEGNPSAVGAVGHARRTDFC
jgi:hypothetical protein